MTPVLDGLITSKTRIRILMRLFLNPTQKAYLRELSNELSVSSGLMSEELKHLSNAGLLSKDREGRQINYQANTAHPLFPELQSMVRKALGMDRIIDSIVERLGDLKQAWLIDDYAEGKDTGLIDLVLVGDIDQTHLADLTKKTERYIDRKIRSLAVSEEEFSALQPTLATRSKVLLWSSNTNAVER